MILPDDPGRTHHFEVPREEHGTHVAWSEWGKLPEDPHEARRDIGQGDLHFDSDLGSPKLLRHHLPNGLIEGFSELVQARKLDSQPCGILMTAELNDLFLASLEGLIDIEARNAPGRAFRHSVDRCHHDGG